MGLQKVGRDLATGQQKQIPLLYLFICQHLGCFHVLAIANSDGGGIDGELTHHGELTRTRYYI